MNVHRVSEFVELIVKDEPMILNVNSIKNVTFRTTQAGKRFCVVEIYDSVFPLWCEPEEYQKLKRVCIYPAVMVSNDLKQTETIKPRGTTRRGKQPARNYHLPAQVPLPHVFESPKSWDGLGEYPLCITCILPQNHPCHNASNPIEEKPNVNQHQETPTR